MFFILFIFVGLAINFEFLKYKMGLNGVPSGRNEFEMKTLVDFDVAHWNVKVLEAQEPGKNNLSSKYCLYMKKSQAKMNKIQNIF